MKKLCRAKSKDFRHILINKNNKQTNINIFKVLRMSFVLLVIEMNLIIQIGGRSWDSGIVLNDREERKLKLKDMRRPDKD